MRSRLLPQNLRPFVYALQNLDRNFANLVAPPTNEMFSALQSTSGPVTDVVNSVQIDA